MCGTVDILNYESIVEIVDAQLVCFRHLYNRKINCYETENEKKNNDENSRKRNLGGFASEYSRLLLAGHRLHVDNTERCEMGA